MADTMRTIATLELLLADNTSGLISPQDLRDAVLATMRPGHGEISVTSQAATDITDTVTWVQVAGTYEETAGDLNWDMTQSGRLYYTGAAERMVHIAASISMDVAANNQVLEFAIAKDGTVLTPSRVRRYMGTGADVGSTALHGFTTITNGSYIAVVCRNTTSAADITAETLNLFALDMAM